MPLLGSSWILWKPLELLQTKLNKMIARILCNFKNQTVCPNINFLATIMKPSPMQWQNRLNYNLKILIQEAKTFQGAVFLRKIRSANITRA